MKNNELYEKEKMKGERRGKTCTPYLYYTREEQKKKDDVKHTGEIRIIKKGRNTQKQKTSKWHQYRKHRRTKTKSIYQKGLNVFLSTRPDPSSQTFHVFNKHARLFSIHRLLSAYSQLLSMHK